MDVFIEDGREVPKPLLPSKTECDKIHLGLYEYLRDKGHCLTADVTFGSDTPSRKQYISAGDNTFIEQDY